VNVVRWSTAGGALVAGAALVMVTSISGIPVAHAKNGDTHITSVGSVQTVSAVTMQGSGNTVVADNVVNDITVYGFNQTALFKSGEPALIDRGRELGMVNRLDRVPA
jgi:hypothetical protein